MRIGFGYDAHRLKQGRRCVLCGVDIPCEFGPDGHSDADVPVHALMDAMLGALAMGDIGGMFPDSDEQWCMADSIELLKLVYAKVQKAGYSLGNADITIILESPALSRHIYEMQSTLAQALGINRNRIGIKATTEEKMGFTGDGTGIASTAAVLLKRI